MTFPRLLVMSALLLPWCAVAHNFVQGQPVAPVTINDRGELRLDQGNISYHPWNSRQLAGKVRVVQYIAGRTSAKDKNSMLITAVKDAAFPAALFQPTTIVNTDDVIPGTGYFVRGKIEKNQKRYPWAQFIIDSNGLARSRWQLKAASSTIVVLDRQGRVRWAKDGALTPAEVSQVISLVEKLITEE